MRKREKRHVWTTLFAGIVIFLCLVPFLVVFVGGFWQEETGVSVQAYYDVFLGSPRYLFRFWRSLGLCLCITAGQIIVSVMAGYGFVKCTFRERVMYFFLMILMVLPLQVTLVPNYIMLDQMDLLGTDGALILPGIFVPLGTFIITQSFRAVPDDVVDVAQLDGCGLWRILLQVAVSDHKEGSSVQASWRFWMPGIWWNSPLLI